MSSTLCRVDQNMKVSTKETFAICALTILAGTFVDTKCIHDIPRMSFNSSEIEGELLRCYCTPPAAWLRHLPCCMHASNMAISAATEVTTAGRFQYLTADGYWATAKNRKAAAEGHRRKVWQSCTQ